MQPDEGASLIALMPDTAAAVIRRLLDAAAPSATASDEETAARLAVCELALEIDHMRGRGGVGAPIYLQVNAGEAPR